MSGSRQIQSQQKIKEIGQKALIGSQDQIAFGELISDYFY
jgi:hypothetical protein